ncbi:MAG: zinc-ribbon domain-containing protein [Parafannyhessea sp.]|uniref:zinc-ribbon domain-containing protein n=1 Tax=Parafannyhessea sp. TaxID=2847324 RepID=UPI003F0F724D
MLPKFCPKCGSPLKPGQEFCMVCGTNLREWEEADDAEFRPEDLAEEISEEDPTLVSKSPVADGPVTEPVEEPDPDDPLNEDAEPEPVEPQEHAETVAERLEEEREREAAAEREPELPRRGERPTFDVIDSSHAPVQAPVGTNPTESRFQRSDTFWTSDRRVIVGILAATLVITLVSALVTTRGYSFSDPQAKNVTSRKSETTDSSDSSSSSKSSSASSSKSSKTSSNSSSKKSTSSKKKSSESSLTADEKAQKQAISAYSDKLKSYRSQVDTAISDYKTLYVATRDQREAKRASLETLIQELQADQSANAALAYQETATFYRAWVATDTCYKDLVTVAQQVDRYWRIDLGYNYPSYYPQVLLDPINQSTAEGGDIYQTLSDYDTNYAQITFKKDATSSTGSGTTSTDSSSTTSSTGTDTSSNQ